MKNSTAKLQPSGVSSDGYLTHHLLKTRQNKRQSLLSVEELHDRYEALKPEITKRLDEFKKVSSNDYFYELAYCLLTPQSSAVNAGKAVTALRKKNFQKKKFNPEALLYQKDYYIRFHKTKAKHLVEMKDNFPLIARELSNGNASVELREWLMKNVKGLGWKEASHFLRNIGHKNLSILDRHILKNLIRCGVLKQLPKSLTTKEYMRIEILFLKFAERVNITMDELDLLFWSMETGQILK
ncbi:MAG: N-glycosylase/DNA lyase [Bacteroidetes bacterium]|nr:MAG: N-glycosylase/DNA lyase [Bacteroidota bacterium]